MASKQVVFHPLCGKKVIQVLINGSQLLQGRQRYPQDVPLIWHAEICEYGIMHDIGRYDQKVIVLQMINLISYNIIHMAAYKVQQFIKFMIMGFYCRVSNIPVVVQLKIIGVHIMLQHFFTVG